jgi:hypothetical protein
MAALLSGQASTTDVLVQLMTRPARRE